MSDGLKSVFFSGVPLSVTERQLRRLFGQTGHIVGFRMMPPLPGKEFQSGFVDYIDGRSADDAISQLDGNMFGEAKMKVSNASSRKRGRGPQGGAGGTDDGTGLIVNRQLMEFKRGFQNLFLPGDQLIEGALRRMPIAEAYEAVEQLRILVLERVEDARTLLENNPQLAVAVVMILQHADKLPLDHLPEEAVVAATGTMSQLSSTAGTASSLQPLQPSVVEAAVDAAPSADVVAQVMSIIERMTPEDVEKVVAMTPAQLAAIPDDAARKQLAFLQRQLKLMDAAS